MVRLPGWSCQIKSSAGCPVESALRKNNKACFRSLPCAVFDVLFVCVCVFVGFLLNLALCRSWEAAGRERGAGEQRLGEAERGGPGGPLVEPCRWG